MLKYIIEKKTADEGTALDYVGTILSIIGLFSLVLGMILAGRYGWWEAKRPFLINGNQNGNQVDLLGLSPTPYLIGIGLIFVIAFIHQISLNMTISQMIFPMGVFGLGMGLLIAHLVNLILSSVEPKDSPEASGTNNAMDPVGEFVRNLFVHLKSI